MGGINTTVIEGADAPANSTTPYELSAGQTARGTLTSGDHDRYKITLVAGQTYTFALVGTGLNSLVDPYLRLYGADGVTLIAQDDDSLPNNNSIITYTPTASGTYYLDAAAALATQAGQYGVSMTLGSKASFDNDMIGGILDTHRSWSTGRGTGVTVTFGFRDTYTGTETNFSHATPEQQAAIIQILQIYSELTGIKFQQVNPGGFTDNATMLFSNYSASDGAGAYAYYPGSTAATSNAGDVWMNTSVSRTSLPPGSYSFFALMHEIGHALGLSHPGEYNAGAGVSISYSASAQFVQDTQQFTNMSYWGASNTGASLGGYPDTPMVYDILALQLKYGANMTTRTGDTVYGFGSTAGSLYDFAINTSPAIAIWDAGGVDTINASGFSQNQLISLNSGDYSNVGGQVKNLSIAFGATIENAIGGQGNDTLLGNEVSNVLTGGNGRDTLDGGDGNDTLEGDGAGTRAGGQVALAHLNKTYSGSGWSDTSLQRTGFAMPASALTFEMVLRLDTPPSYASRIISYGDNAWDGYGGQDFTLRADLYQKNYEILIGGQSFDTGLPLSTTFIGTDPSRLSISWNRADGAIAVYLNGKLVKSGTVGAGAVLPATATLDIMDGSFQTIKGSIGDIRVWNTVRTPAQIDANAWTTLSSPATEAGLVANWQLNTGAGAGVFSDASGHLGNLMPVSVTVANTPFAETHDFATNFADTLRGGLGNDSLLGGAGNDALDGGAGADALRGGDGDDTLTFDLDDTLVDGGPGSDTAILVQGNTAAARAFNMAANGIERLEWQENGNAYLMTLNGDGTRTETVTDTAGTEATFAARTTWFDSAGRLDRANITTDAGLTTEIDYDNVSAQPWYSIANAYGPGNILTTTTTVYDDNSRSVLVYDVAGTELWSQQQDMFDAAGRLDSRTTVFDGGARQVVDYDQVPAEHTWSVITQDYDALDRLTRRETVNDTGSRQVAEYDAANADAVVAQVTRSYSATNALMSVDTLRDNGQRVLVSYDFDSTQTWSQTTMTYDAQGRSLQRDRINDNGTRQITDYDPANADPLVATVTTTRSAANAIMSVDTMMDDGRRVLVTHDHTRTQVWSQIKTSYDAQNRVTQRETLNDNGTRLRVDYDPANADPLIAQVATTFSAAGAIMTVDTTFDDGRKTSVAHDHTGVQPWSQIISSYDAAGLLDTKTTLFDNGKRQVIDYDQVPAAHLWRQVTQNFDAANRLESTETIMDDGTREVVYEDAAGVQAWSRQTVTYDARGVLDKRVYLNDDGTRQVIDYDQVPAAHNWKQITQTFDALNRLESTETIFDDGTREVVSDDVAGTQSWSRQTLSYDANGALDLRTYLYDDGSRQVIDFDQNPAEHLWQMVSTTYSAANEVMSVKTTLDDGTRSTITYDHDNSQAWSRITTVLDAAGNADTKETVNDNGTRLVVDYDQVQTDHAWSQMTVMYDDHGREDYRDYRMDDGSRIMIDYDQAGVAAWTSWERDYLTSSTTTLYRQVITYDNGTTVTL